MRKDITQEEACDVLYGLGFREHQPSDEHNVRFFGRRDLIEGPDCACNDRPPTLIARVSSDFTRGKTTATGSVTFEIFGEVEGLWINARIHPVRRDKIAEKLPIVQKAATSIWKAYYAAISTDMQCLSVQHD